MVPPVCVVRARMVSVGLLLLIVAIVADLFDYRG
jgi:hypothetical protein